MVSSSTCQSEMIGIKKIIKIISVVCLQYYEDVRGRFGGQLAAEVVAQSVQLPQRAECSDGVCHQSSPGQSGRTIHCLLRHYCSWACLPAFRDSHPQMQPASFVEIVEQFSDSVATVNGIHGFSAQSIIGID